MVPAPNLLSSTSTLEQTNPIEISPNEPLIQPIEEYQENPEPLESESASTPEQPINEPPPETESSRPERHQAAKNITLPVYKNKDPLIFEVEKIMEDGLESAFLELSEVQKQEFKIQGEKTASEIRVLLRSAHVKLKKIFKLILEWLKLLPGVNRFFLIQEAKIKTDKIIALKEKMSFI